MEEEVLRGELEATDTSLGFLFLIVLAVLLSFVATAKQRDGVWLRLQGEDGEEEEKGVVAMRLAAAALVTGSLGFFFQQALEMGAQADLRDPPVRRLTKMNIISGFLVLLASLIRLFALNLAQRFQPSLAQALPPE